MSEEEGLKKAVEQRKAENAAKAQEAADPSRVAIAEWKKCVAPQIEAAVRAANKVSTDAGIQFALRPAMPNRKVTQEGTIEFPAIAIEKSSGQHGLASRLPGSGAPAVEERPPAEPYLDVRLGIDERIVVTARGCSITRGGNFSLEEFNEARIRDTVLEFARAAVELPDKPPEQLR